MSSALVASSNNITEGFPQHHRHQKGQRGHQKGQRALGGESQMDGMGSVTRWLTIIKYHQSVTICHNVIRCQKYHVDLVIFGALPSFGSSSFCQLGAHCFSRASHQSTANGHALLSARQTAATGTHLRLRWAGQTGGHNEK